MRDVKRLAGWFFTVVLGLGLALGSSLGFAPLVSFLAGAGMIAVTFLGTMAALSRIIPAPGAGEKGIAVTLGLIVVKYIVLVAALFALGGWSAFHPMAFAGGVFCFALAAALTALSHPPENLDGRTL